MRLMREAALLCLVLFAVTSSIKFAGDACRTGRDCAQTAHHSKCECDTEHGHFSEGICMDNPPFSGSCMTKFKWAKYLLKRKGKKKAPIPQSPKSATEIAYKTEACSTKQDCFQKLGSKCFCVKSRSVGKCFGGKCMDRKTALAKKSLLSALAKPPKLKKVEIVKEPQVQSGSSRPMTKENEEFGNSLKSFGNSLSLFGNSLTKYGAALSKRTFGANQDDFGDQLYDDNDDYVQNQDVFVSDDIALITQVIVMVVGIIIFCICCAFCIGLNAMIAYIGCYFGKFAAEIGKNQNYKLIETNDVNDDQQNQI